MTTTSSMTHDLAVAGRNSTPPLLVSAAHWVTHMTLADWVSLATLIYIGAQLAYLCWKWGREGRQKASPPAAG